MFIGHFGAGFAAKKITRNVSLGTLFMAAQFIDLIWPIFLLIGIERVEIAPGNTAFTPLNFIYYPFTHSFIGTLIWGVMFALVYYLIKKDKRNSLILGALVLSHWILDLIVHRPDLPLVPWNKIKLGLGLWNSIFSTIIVEGLIFVAGAYVYIYFTKAMNKKGLVGLWAILIFLAVIYVMNIIGPPPESSQQIAIVGLSQWILVIWAYWIDSNRSMTNLIKGVKDEK